MLDFLNLKRFNFERGGCDILINTKRVEIYIIITYSYTIANIAISLATLLAIYNIE